MKRKYLLAALEWSTEIIILCILHTLLGFDRIGVYRYVLMFVVLSAALEGDHFSTVLIWQESKKIIICNIVFFFVAIVMQPLKTLTFEIIFQNAMLCLLLSIFTIITERTYRVIFYKYFAQNVLIIGTGEQAQQLVQTCQRNRFSLQHVVGVVEIQNLISTVETANNVDSKSKFNVPVYIFSEIKDVIRSNAVTQVIIVAPEAPREVMNYIFDTISPLVPAIKSCPQINALVSYDSKIEDFDGNILISSATYRGQIFDRLLKRCLDVVASLIGCLSLIPLTVYVKIKFLQENDHGSIFFTQNRIGKDGRIIRIFKYRTMIPNAEHVLIEMMENDPAVAHEYSLTKKLRHDPRITTIGAFLRKTSLDEFPQFINVLIGDMSLVGPRPYLEREIPDMGQFYHPIVTVKPGITGMWQVSGRSDLSFKDRCRLDDYYVRNWSIWMDVTILIKTIRAIISHEGAL